MTLWLDYDPYIIATIFVRFTKVKMYTHFEFPETPTLHKWPFCSICVLIIQLSFTKTLPPRSSTSSFAIKLGPNQLDNPL